MLRMKHVSKKSKNRSRNLQTSFNAIFSLQLIHTKTTVLLLDNINKAFNILHPFLNKTKGTLVIEH